MKGKYLFLTGLALVAMVLVLAACSTPPQATPCPTAEAVTCPECPDCPEAPPCPEPEPCPEPVVKDVPFEELWANSPHNDAASEAFVHWDEDDPAEVPTSCAKCHSSTGMLDFLGVDGSEVGSVETAVPVPGGTVACITCHNSGTVSMTSVTFPSGLEVTGLGNEAICMQCHQGRASKVTVDETIARFEATDVDAMPAPIKDANGNDQFLGFINIHYYPAGATLYGTQAKGGYEYDGKVYDGKFRHVEGIDTCVGCHNTHSLEVKVEACAECHTGVASAEDLASIRMQGSLADYDGDGDTSESIASELLGLQEILYGAIQAYAKDVAGTGIVYDATAYPYFFADADGDGTPDAGENGPVRYSTWTPRLLKAAYNYQDSAKDPGAFAHNAKYMIQLMYDSVEDLNLALGSIDMTAMHREDPGHFAGSTEAFRHWDADGEVPGSCARCHSATGLPTFIKEGVNISAEISNGFMCTTCHNEAEWPALFVLNEVTFPSGAKLTFGEGNDANLCLACHQGRSSGPTVARGLAGKPGDTVDETVRFSNVHYFAAGATLFGSEAKGMYEMEGKEYVAKHPHLEEYGYTCASCHNVHALEIKTEACAGCHPGATSVDAVRFGDTDWDGDGDVTEGVAGEVATMGEKLYEAMKVYAAEKSVGIVYNPFAYPYFFEDADGDGVADTTADGAVRYSKFTPNLAIAAYNYQYYQKDPGAFAHNAKYVMQNLYDTIQLLGGDVTGMTRP
jgi:hypothetical protein